MGCRLRQCRNALGLSISDAAHALGVCRQTVYRWEWGRVGERGGTPALTALCALADLYSCSIGWIVRGEGAAPAYLRAKGETCLTG